MKLLFRIRYLRLLAGFALLLFAGDMAADQIDDLYGIHCDSQSQSLPSHDKSPCSHCSCATHMGTVVLADFTLRVGADMQLTVCLHGDDQARPPRLADSIDHPPQLA
jgi:hypothetical protein